MAEQTAIAVDVVSDVVCPWCYIGQKRLETALSAVPEIDVTVRWRPYQLDPTIPPQGKDRAEYMLGKFGSAERIREIHARIEPLGAAVGIAFDFGAIKVAPNTLDAHRLIRWAANDGPATQNRLVAGLFAAYFESGLDVGDRLVLVEIARAAGMDGAIVETMLATDADRPEVAAEIETAGRMGITGVPCFLLERRYAVMGAQEAATLADAIRQVSAAKARGELDAAG